MHWPAHVSVALDIDFTSVREGTSPTAMTYAAVTARSYHPGAVNVALMDGSTRPVSDSISLPTWRALVSRAGGDVVGDY